jgi:hypothetical protein
MIVNYKKYVHEMFFKEKGINDSANVAVSWNTLNDHLAYNSNNDYNNIDNNSNNKYRWYFIS